MTFEHERERRANQIVRNADLYASDPDYRMMVDNTVYLTSEEKEKSQVIVDLEHGTQHSSFDRTRWAREYGA
jgi:hypothetical protein